MTTPQNTAVEEASTFIGTLFGSKLYIQTTDKKILGKVEKFLSALTQK